MVTLVMEMEPQKAEHLHRYVHSFLAHPPHLPVTAVSRLAHPSSLGLGRKYVPQMHLWGWMLASGGRRSQPAPGGYDSSLRYRGGEQWSNLNTGLGCGRNWAELRQDRDLGRSLEVALKPELGMVTDPGVGTGVRCNLGPHGCRGGGWHVGHMSSGPVPLISGT